MRILIIYIFLYACLGKVLNYFLGGLNAFWMLRGLEEGDKAATVGPVLVAVCVLKTVVVAADKFRTLRERVS